MIETRLRDRRGGNDSNVPQAEDRGTRQRPARPALAASVEGRILRVGLLLTAVLLMALAIDRAQLLNRFRDWAATFNRFAPFGLGLAVVLLGVAARIVRQRRQGGIHRVNGAQ